jgi:uncharacterized protein
MKSTSKGIASFLVLAFGIAWIGWEIPIVMGIPVTSPEFRYYALPGAFAPALAAVIVRKWITREGFGDAGLKFDMRQWRYYVVAWLLPIAVVLAIAAEASLAGIGDADFSIVRAVRAMGSQPPVNLLPYVGMLIFPQLLLKALLLTFVLWGEEFGWRGYLQLRLFPDRPLLAAVVTGVIWAAWHYPLIFRGYNYPDQPWLGVALFPVTCILLSIIFGWLRQRSGSIWTASLAHSATDVVGANLTIYWFYGVASQVWVGYQGVLAWLPLGAICIWIVHTRGLQPSASTAEK